MVPAVLYATAKLYRAVAIVHAIVWHGSGRGVGIFSLVLVGRLMVISAELNASVEEHRARQPGS